MIKKHLGVVAPVLGLLVMLANPVLANDLTAATATADCSGFNLSVTAINLDVGTTYMVDFTFTLTPPSGPAITVPGTITFTAAAGTETHTASGPWPGAPLSGDFTVTGSATLIQSGSVLPITINGVTSAVLSCGGTGCPATIGFWKHHSFTSLLPSGLTIGGVAYSSADLLTILKTAPHGNAVLILGKQLVGALINLAAGAQHNPVADAAIATAESLLASNSLNLLTSNVDPSTSVGSALVAQSDILDGYNSSNFNTCSEASGLNF
jgi:hypothetical protein